MKLKIKIEVSDLYSKIIEYKIKIVSDEDDTVNVVTTKGKYDSLVVGKGPFTDDINLFDDIFDDILGLYLSKIQKS